MSTLWEVPVATVDDREVGMSRRLLRTASVERLPRDARPGRARHERLPAALRAYGASWRRVETA